VSRPGLRTGGGGVNRTAFFDSRVVHVTFAGRSFRAGPW
jgi:hypothetical protein